MTMWTWLRARIPWAVLALAVVVGLGVAALGRAVAGGACPRHEVVGVTSCGELVASLSDRAGVVAALAVVFMAALSIGLLRTWSSIEDRRAERPAVP
jgi:hypothetical protein